MEPRDREAPRADEPPPGGAVVSLADWLAADGDELARATTACTCRGTTPRYLRRNALVALGNTGGAETRRSPEPYAEGDDPLLREHAEWALARLDGSAS